jgi:hypothetical protein
MPAAAQQRPTLDAKRLAALKQEVAAEVDRMQVFTQQMVDQLFSFGDVRLAFMIGLFLGWLHPILALYGLLLGSLVGVLLGVVSLVARAGSRFAFGPALATAIRHGPSPTFWTRRVRSTSAASAWAESTNT